MNEIYIAHKDNNRVQTVSEHLENTATFASMYACKLDLKITGEIMGLIHDLGKYSDEFQARILYKIGKPDHATYGANYLYKLIDSDTTPNMRILIEIICLCSISHHGGLIDVIESNGKNKFFDRLLKLDSEYKSLENRGSEILNRVRLLICSDEFKTECEIIRNQMKSISSGKNNEEILFLDSLLIKFLYSCLIDADRTDTINFHDGINKPVKQYDWGVIVNALDNNNKKFDKNELNRVRNEIYTICASKGSTEKGLFKFSVPTGGGKTLSSFRFAAEHARVNNMKRIIYVVPYLSIIEQNVNVIKNILQNNNLDTDILIESHSNLIYSEYEDTTTSFNLTTNWNGQIIFTTMVTFLESVFCGGTQGIRRFHNMADSVIIFDEIQQLPIKTIHMTNMLIVFLNQLCNSSVLLCSATQPLLDKVYNKNRCLTGVEDIIKSKYDILRRVVIEDSTRECGYDYNQIADFALDKLINTDNILIIVNTKRSASELYKILSKTYNNKIYYLTTNLCPEHRSDIIQDMKRSLKGKEKLICISTPLIEAGVDIDFNCVIRFTAGFDSIIQASGRCNREGKLTEGYVYVLNCNCEAIHSLTDIKKGQMCTIRILQTMKRGLFTSKDFLSEEVINKYYEYYFYERDNEMSYNIFAKRCNSDTNLFELMSTNRSAVREYENTTGYKYSNRIRQAFKTVGYNFKVIDDYQIGVLVPYGDGKNLIDNLYKMRKSEILRQAQRYTVNIFKSKLEKCVNIEFNKDIGIYILNNNYYSSILGMTDDTIESDI